MALVLKGEELIATEPLSSTILVKLIPFALRRPLRINGIDLEPQDLEQLIEEANRTGLPVQIGSVATEKTRPIYQQWSSKIGASSKAIEYSSTKEAERGRLKNQLMRTHREKVLAHAHSRLAETANLADPDEIAARLKTFLKIEDHRLKIAHRFGASGLWTTQARSFVVDLMIEHAFCAATWPGEGGEFLENAKTGCAVVALGGYGRGDLAPFSDVDLLFLHTGRRAKQMRQLVERILRLLWDAGLTIGHSFRTVNECISAARTDPHLQTALATTRFLCGHTALYDCLTVSLERERRKRGDAFIEAVKRERDERYGKFGAVVCLQEPNVKESAGGLRDMHTALWIAYSKYGCQSIDDMRGRDLISEEEQRLAEKAYDFLLRVRYEAHLLTNRKTDRIALDLQPAIAERFGYVSEHHLLASEKFMRDYYHRAQEINWFSESILARATETELKPSRWFNWQRTARLAEPFSITDGRLQLEGDPQIFVKSPLKLFDAFALAQAADVTFSHGLREAIGQSLIAIDKNFRNSPEAADAFLKLLRRRGRVGHVLRLMHETGFLGRYIPEWGHISLLIQHDLYHHYTVDEHTLIAIDALDELDNSQDRQRSHFRSILDKVEDIGLLYLSLLFHDIGKGRGSGHIPRGVKISERICPRLHLDPESTAKVLQMVNLHVAMSHIAQRRDINEPQVAIDFAAQVGTLDILNMLLLLTYADLHAVAPGVWSDWKGSLLWDLYQVTLVHLDGGQEQITNINSIKQLKEEVMHSLEGKIPLSEIERHFALLPERYERTTKADTVANHLLLIEQLKSDPVSCYWRQQSKSATELTICTRDRHGLFADIAGTLTTQGTEILSAELNTREDGIAIDVIILRDAATHHALEEYRREPVERALKTAITGSSDVTRLFEKWRTNSAPRRKKSIPVRRTAGPHIICDNDSAQASTLLEVRTADEPGLAYKISSAITEEKLDIVCAKIATEKSDALDVFYITDSNGMKLSEAAMRSLETALLEKLSINNMAIPTFKVKETKI
jgi:[protein-PII] uridylyltransferase